MSHPIYNLHNHTPFSDGAYTIDELCEAHLACKPVQFDGIGITDNLFCTPSSREIQSERDFERTFAKETRDYVEAVERWMTHLRRECAESRIDYVPIQTSTPYDRALFSYLEKRKRLG